MRILIIGGGRFLGRAFAAEALAAGHQVTVFNRGKTSVDLDGVRVVHGDREDPADLARLVAAAPAAADAPAVASAAAASAPAAADGGAGWDAVVDTCGFKPAVVGRSAKALAGSARVYLFISSINAYAQWPAEPVRDGSPKFECGPEKTVGEYGPLKAGCERAVLAHFPDRTICIDAGLILGPQENAGRLTWWLSRIARGGDVLAPGDPARRIGPIDARDIARFGLSCIENGHYGAFPTTGPGTESMGDLLEACVAATGSGARLVWADEEFVAAQGVGEWTGLPLWALAEGESRSVWDVHSDRALKAGLVCRPIAETVRDTWEWLRDAEDLSDEDGLVEGHGTAPEKEAAVLAAWENEAR
ncbi:MAG TPA: NAD-dependent epimerase/dehydratase family protein [Actinospica sp.]|jgi:2'-hydroxyisoflavone reductase|nr:NAD-dependent epimerase/dehydratase family protein [Actinospica sp.]